MEKFKGSSVVLQKHGEDRKPLFRSADYAASPKIR